MRKASLAISIVSICLSVVTLALVVLEFLYKKTTYLDSDIK